MSKRVRVIDLFGSLPESPAAAVRGATSPSAKKGEAVAGVMRPLEREKGPSLQKNEPDETEKPSERVRYKLPMKRRGRDPPWGHEDAAYRPKSQHRTSQSASIVGPVPVASSSRHPASQHIPLTVTPMRSSTPPFPEPASAEKNSIEPRRRPVRACRIKTKPIIDRPRHVGGDETGESESDEEEDTSPLVQDPLPDVYGPPPKTEIWHFSIPPHKNFGATFFPFSTAPSILVPPQAPPAVSGPSEPGSRDKGKAKSWGDGGGGGAA